MHERWLRARTIATESKVTYLQPGAAALKPHNTRSHRCACREVLIPYSHL